ncbi:MAG: putative manganese transporter, partial [Prevotellaceae bacterium]|nr:putative manganese transporter [Prevotellaceae bacterium]
DHFLEEHLWGHVIKKHFFKIFLWTLGALTVVAFLDYYIDAQTWVRDNKFYMLIAAILVGIIPASGPHLVFVFMFAQHNIVFSILLANTIMQDGHAGIPLLAESKKSFIYLKLAKLVLAIVVGVCGFIWEF